MGQIGRKIEKDGAMVTNFCSMIICRFDPKERAPPPLEDLVLRDVPVAPKVLISLDVTEISPSIAVVAMNDDQGRIEEPPALKFRDQCLRELVRAKDLLKGGVHPKPGSIYHGTGRRTGHVAIAIVNVRRVGDLDV